MTKVRYDYGLLKDRMKELGIKQMELAKMLDISESTFSIKMNNGNYFTQEEIGKMIKILHLSENEARNYFFTEKV